MCCMIDFRWHTVDCHFANFSRFVLNRSNLQTIPIRVNTTAQNTLHGHRIHSHPQSLEMTKLLLSLFKMIWSNFFLFMHLVGIFLSVVRFISFLFFLFCLVVFFSFAFSSLGLCHAGFPLCTVHVLSWKSPLYYLICHRLTSILSR